MMKKLLLTLLICAPFLASAQTTGQLIPFLKWTNATGTQATTTSLFSTKGSFDTICLTSDTCRTTWPSSGGGAYPFQGTNNSTSTLTGFTVGLYANASSTLNNFTFNNATGTSATTTSFSSDFITVGTSILPLVNGTPTLGNTFNGFASLWLKDSASAFDVGLQVTNTGAGGSQNLTFDVGNFSPTLHFLGGAGDPTLGNWFDQNVKTNGTPQFSTLLLTSSSTLQNFTARNATTTNATTTSIISTTASTTNLYLAAGGGTLGCLQVSAIGLVTNTGTACGSGSGGGNSKWATSTVDLLAISPSNALKVGIGTTTPQWALQVASTTGAQLTLSDPTSLTSNHWSFRNQNGLFALATSSPSTFATSSVSALTINANGLLTFANFLTSASSTLQNFTGLNSTTTNATTTSLAISSITSCSGSSALTTNSAGTVACGALSGSTNFLTNSSANTFLNTGTNLQAPVFQATSTTASSSIVTALGVGTTSAPSVLTIGTSTLGSLTTPIAVWIGNRGLASGSSGGTYIGLNAPPSFAGNYIDLQNTDTSQFSVRYDGAVNMRGGLSIAAGNIFGFSGRSTLTSASDGTFEFINSAQTDFTRLQFGGTSSSFPGLAKTASGPGLAIQLADGTNGGVFGVGTSTPQWTAQLASSTRPQLTLTDPTGAGTHISFREVGSTLYIASSSPSTFATSSNPALSIDTNQQAGINLGTSTSYAIFNLGNSTIDASVASTTVMFSVWSNASSTPSIRVESPNNNGTVLIATTTNAVNKLGVLAVGGKMYWSGITGANTGDYVCYNTITGEIDQSGTACSLSSLRFKENIQPYPFGLDAVLKLRPVTFNFKAGLGKDTKKLEEGFIAEEVYKVDPSLVGYDDKGVISSLDYPKFVVMLTKAVQDVWHKVMNHDSRISSLEKENAAMKTRIEALETKIK